MVHTASLTPDEIERVRNAGSLGHPLCFKDTGDKRQAYIGAGNVLFFRTDAAKFQTAWKEALVVWREGRDGVTL